MDYTQRSFSGGELSPSLYARTDFNKYPIGAKKIRNFIVLKHGGISTRPGTRFVGEVKNSTKRIRKIKFKFNNQQTYILELGEGYIRFIKQGNYIYEASQAVTNITTGATTVFTVTGHGYSTGQEIFVSDVEGPDELNVRSFKVVVIDPNNFEIRTMDNQAVNSAGYDPYVSGGIVERIYEVMTNYVEADLPLIQYNQSADVITFVHNNYPPSELSRFGDANWTFAAIAFKSDVGFPTAIVTGATGPGTRTRSYKVTSIRKEDYRESNAGINNTAYVIASITQANPARVTLTAPPVIEEGDEIYLLVNGMTQLNDRRFIATNIAGGAFDLVGIDSTNYGVFTSGTARQAFIRIQQDTISASSPRTLTWQFDYTTTDAEEFNVYRQDDLSGAYGLVGVTKGNTFVDVGLAPDYDSTPPSERNPFVNTNDYPGVIGSAQQRRFYGKTYRDIEKVMTSKVGDYNNFGVSSPLRDDDAITFKINSSEVNEIMHILDLGKVVILTSGSENVINGDQAGAITPTSINPKAQTYNGSSYLRPLIVNKSALYVQARGSIIRDLFYTIDSDGYDSNDLTELAFHLFEKNTLVDWDYQQQPHSVLWVVRDDGILLGLTYVKNQGIFAWHRHDFQDGFVENVCSVPEGVEDAVYVTVRRTINGRTTRYVERFTQRRIDDIKDFVGMDSTLSFDGRNTDATTMTISNGTTWKYDETLTLTASASFFISSDPGNAVLFYSPALDDLGNQKYDIDGEPIMDQYRFTIEDYTSDTVVTGKMNRTVPTALRNVSTTVWEYAVDEVSGLWHLEGQNVSIFADAFVEASPNNPSHQIKTVTNGKVQLDDPHAVIHVGLPFVCDMQTLSIDATQQTLQNKKMIAQEVTMFCEETRGLWAGKSEPVADYLTGLTEVVPFSEESEDAPPKIKTDTLETQIAGTYDNKGRAFVRQVDPLPATILSITTSGIIPVGA